jgi:hypothetical protein
MRGKILKRGVLFKFTMYSLVATDSGDSKQMKNWKKQLMTKI